MSTTQMLKGVIDGCLLAIIKNKEVYGYKLAEKLDGYEFKSFSEGDNLSVIDANAKGRVSDINIKKVNSRTKKEILQTNT